VNSRPRIVLLHIVAAALVAAGWWAGALTIILQADRVYAGPVIGAVALVALVYGWYERWDVEEWIADKLPYLGMIGTVTGVLLAFHEHPDLNAATAVDIGKSLVSNLYAFTGCGWLLLIRQVCEKR